jgi:hypothetical protein
MAIDVTDIHTLSQGRLHSTLECPVDPTLSTIRNHSILQVSIAKDGDRNFRVI